MSEGLRYERYFWFHGQVRASRYPNSGHLSEEFGVSVRTALRDIDFMRVHFNAPLDYDRIRRGFYYTDASFELPSHWISETNILSLSLAVRLASTIPDPSLKDDLCRLIERITGTNGKDGNSCMKNLPEKISVKNIEYSRVDTEIFRQVVEALFDDQAVSITYHSPHNNEISNRTIRPLHLMHYMGSWYLLAWCATKRALRDFALARIKKIFPVKEMIALPADLPSIKDYTRQHFGIMQGYTTSEVILRFSPKICPWISEQTWHPQQKASVEKDGSLLLSFPVAGFRELVKIILSHGAEVQVVEPPELQILVKREIERMVKIYFHHDIA